VQPGKILYCSTIKEGSTEADTGAKKPANDQPVVREVNVTTYPSLCNPHLLQLQQLAGKG
jgi:hypothetical protein